jgi:hypothetical protein
LTVSGRQRHGCSSFLSTHGFFVKVVFLLLADFSRVVVLGLGREKTCGLNGDKYSGPLPMNRDENDVIFVVTSHIISGRELISC